MSLYRQQRNYGCRIHDAYSYRGMRTVVLENELVRVSVLADKGTDIFEFLYKPRDLDFVWLTDNGVHNPNAYLPTSPDPVSTFIDYYEGGWQEILPNGGPPSAYLGAQFGQHGEVAQMPWDCEIAEDTEDQVAVRFRVKAKKMPLVLTKMLSLTRGSAALRIEEELFNASGVPLRFMWGHHLAYGRPFLAPGCRIRLPEGVQVLTENADSAVSAPGIVKRGESFAWPCGQDRTGADVDLSVLPEWDTASDIVYLTHFPDEAWYELRNEALRMGMRVEWDGAEMPHLWFWQEYGAIREYPWYGKHYNIGLEPFAGFPTHGLEEAVRNGSAGSIEPGERIKFRLSASPFELAP